MGVTFDLVDAGQTRTAVYCHITDVTGPNKNAEISDGNDGHWQAVLGVVIHQNQPVRYSDVTVWPDRIPSTHIQRFKWTDGSLDDYPTLAVLYALLKTKLTNIRVDGSAICSNIQDAI